MVLSGSEVGFFEREVVGYSATTYGRRAGAVRAAAVQPARGRLFLPRWSAEDRIRAIRRLRPHAVLLAQIRPQRTLAENILELVLQPDGLLHEEARLLLDQELTNASGFFSILRAIAAGQTRVAQIAERTGIAGGSSRVSQMLDTLQRLWLVDKKVPITVTNPERSRQSRYRIADPYLRFWFRFVLPSRDRLIAPAGAARHLEGRVLPQLDAFVSRPAFEEVCQQWLRSEVDAAAVGWWWGRVRELRTGALRDVDRELDAVAIDDDGAVAAIGSCKWTDGPMNTDELTKLDALAAHLAGDRARPARYCFSRAGFTPQLRAAARRDPGVHLVMPKRLFA